MKEMVIVLGERFSEVSAGNADDFQEYMESFETCEADTVVIDFEKVSYINSMAVGVITSLAQALKRREITVRVINANDRVQKVFKLWGSDLCTPA